MLFIIDNSLFISCIFFFIFSFNLMYDASGRVFESLHGRGRSAVPFVFIVMFLLFTSLFKMHCTWRRHTDGWVLSYYSHNKIIPLLCCFDSKQWNWRCCALELVLWKLCQIDYLLITWLIYCTIRWTLAWRLISHPWQPAALYHLSRVDQPNQAQKISCGH